MTTPNDHAPCPRCVDLSLKLDVAMLGLSAAAREHTAMRAENARLAAQVEAMDATLGAIGDDTPFSLSTPLTEAERDFR